MNFPDKQTLYRVTQGDEAAFTMLYTHFRLPAVKFCTTLLKDEEEAKNVTQDVFAKIWDRRNQIKPEHSFQAYLFVSLRNQVFDQFKKMEKDEMIRNQYLDRTIFFQDEESEDKETRIKFLQAAVESLSTKRKQILKLNLEEGKSYKEIATYLNISTNTVKNQLVKAKYILRQQLIISNPKMDFVG